MTISKDIKFDCAHMLSQYEGKCANLHGHTYHGTVTIEGKANNNTSMVLDYNEVKRIVDQFDHTIIFSADDYRNQAENELLGWASIHNMRHVVLTKGKSTAETIAQVIADQFTQWGKVTVRLSETDGSWAEAHA